MPLRRFRRQHEQLSQFERGRIIGMMESGWSARRVARQLGCPDCVTSHSEDHHIVRNAHVQPTASLATIRAQVAPSLGAPVSSRTIRRHQVEGHLRLRHPLRLLLLMPPIKSSVWSGATHEETGLQRNGTRSSLATNPDSISAVMTILFVCGDPVVNA
ncbi:HTH_Tnp_Tc3_2 domain-containing protein [Trichonephila clavipes]|nr:HTH_Tnp_Tc3_2 domain-containing protein [Trichonephila clavipes]